MSSPLPPPPGAAADAIVRRADRRYATVCALLWLPMGLTIAPLVLLFGERGMALTAVAGFFAAHSLTAALLELPTGGLADVIGRRAVLAAAGLLNAVAFTLQALGTTGWVLALGMGLTGAARALSSGPAEAWYVDTVQAAHGPGAELRTGLARGDTAVSGALAVGTLLGGAAPWLLGLGPEPGEWLREATSGAVLPLSVPPLAGAAVALVFAAYALVALREPERPSVTPAGVLRGVPATVAGGLRLGGRDAVVRRVLIGAAAAGGGLATAELLVPGRAAALTGAAESGAVLFAGLACAGFVCSAIGSRFAPLVARLTGGGERAVLASLSVCGTGLLLLGVTGAVTGGVPLSLAATGYGLLYLGLGAAGPNENDLLHRRVTGAGRATALSVQSLTLQLAGVAAGLTAAALPAGPLPWLPAAAVVFAAALLWARGVSGGGKAAGTAGGRSPDPVRPMTGQPDHVG
ncbi:MFS transporter [Streptomyces sp. CAU 1734]|uniref:MFS transporter n=1 Tax=Streptomyces sp. CAU 1734 TaxID=3140360 RepID=UPI003261980D